jgi:hypothetical protein
MLVLNAVRNNLTAEAAHPSCLLGGPPPAEIFGPPPRTVADADKNFVPTFA